MTDEDYEALSAYNEKIIELYDQMKVKISSKMEELKKSDDKFVRGCYWWLKKKKLLVEYKKYLNGKL